MTAARPFETPNELMKSAEQTWWSLNQEDWLEAFRCHPKIGERKAEHQTGSVAQKWSGQEQSGVGSAAKVTVELLAELNQEYQDRFGYIFIVCATGKSADEMVSILRDRIGNDELKELRIAAGEQAKITKLRLEKLLSE
jgi:OHCU decarboxylase